MAAGLGFKTFATGDVLSATDVNGYLMQGILVFASATARDAAITAPAEGQFAYLKDTNVTTYYTGSAWANVDTTGMTNPMTTTGDTIYSSSGSTPARLGIGTAGQILQVNSGATAPEWVTPAGGGGASFTQLAATATTSGGTVTVTGLSGYNTLWVTWESVGTDTSGEPTITIRFNSDSGANYSCSGLRLTNLSASTTLMAQENQNGSGALTIATQGSSAGNTFSGGLIIEGANTTGVKVGQVICGSSGTNAVGRSGTFRYTGSSVISSVSIITGSGNFDEGTIRVIGSVI
jgi:hypothetical protein